MLTLHIPSMFPLRALTLLWEHHHLPQDTLLKSSSPSKPKSTQHQNLRRMRPCPTTSRVCQPIPLLTITLCNRDPKMVDFLQVLKTAGQRKTRQPLTGLGMVTLIPINRHTVIATFVTDAGIDHLLGLRRVLLSGTMAVLAGRKSALGHVPGPLRVPRPAPGLRRGGRLTDYHRTAPPEAPHRHCLLVAVT